MAGKYVPVNLDLLVEYVSPLAPHWVADVVSREMTQYRVTKEVVHSDLYSKRLGVAGRPTSSRQ
jgi:hypothetical protein